MLLLLCCSDLLALLAAKFGLNPIISFLESLIHIVIAGVNIERELGSALTDFANGNMVGFGYNVASLVKTLL